MFCEKNTVVKSDSTPLVSVIMPIYNAGEYLYPAVKSILQQININLELIMVDDHSTDQAIDESTIHQ